ncbi:uncharacterized protein J7T55_005259 [Diaporthe amygdali]|uniref:uncharacterized protein n=1 Tax=Phomopsis amygdali TaxID=1214568 RepID=UPI0022FE7C44|nr:uncharacterized protein J7T55_005259 [Diaporthe amygdali]KAJ0108282.1 uncharacterized protein J7T55_005259 [Diaporthe amygdali]
MAAPVAVTYTPTAEMPLMKGIRAELVEALDKNESLFEVTLMLGDVVKDLERVRGKVSIGKTLECFEEGVPLLQMASLLHYVNVKLLRSIIAGTLAYDLYQDQDLGANCQYNENCSPGTYVVSLSIKGREGKFLNIKELRALADWVDEYAEGAETWNSNDRTWDDQDPLHIAARDFIKDVDSRAGRADPDVEPRFGPTTEAIKRLRELARMFRRRADMPLDVQNRGETYQIQAPVMVGCTAETIAEGTKAHVPQCTDVNSLYPAANSLQNTTKTWALTVSLLYYMDLEPDIVHVAALPFFNPNDLPLTEILLTTMARSFVWQDGFNVIQGGGKSDENYQNRGYEEKRNVCHARDFLEKNLFMSLERIQELRNKIAIIENLEGMDLDALDIEVNKLQAKKNELQLAVNEYEKSEAKLAERVQAAAALVEQQDEMLQQWRGWNEFLDLLGE